jgi:hypothetical protein
VRGSGPLPPKSPSVPTLTPLSPLTEGQKEELTLQALGLLNEQVAARVVHYRADLKTSPELDAITAQVVQQPAHQKNPQEIETLQAEALTQLLRRVFRADSQFTGRVLKPVGRRVAKLFFESELHQKTQGDREKVIHHAEQGLYYVLSRYRHRLRAELEGFEYASDDIRELTLQLLAKTERELQVGFLSRRSPELNRVMTIYTATLADFLQRHLPPRIAQMGRMTLRKACTAQRPNSVGHKVLADAFPDFRAEWERRFMQQLVLFFGDELLSRLTKERGEFRDETVRFFTDPHVFSDTCAVLCEELYEFLCLEGFLDLPVDWRVGHGHAS